MTPSLITGATGLVGTHLVDFLSRQGREPLALVHNPCRGDFQRECLSKAVKVRGDIRDYHLLKRVLSRYYVDRVYHLASLAEVKSAYKDSYNVYDVNTMGTVALLEAVRQVSDKKNPIKTLILITDKVYGENTMAKESDQLYASEPYATSKITQQYIAESHMETYNLNIVLPHSCNIFGYDPFSNRIFPNVIKKCLQDMNPYIFKNDKSVREYVYVDDVIYALYELMEGDYQGPYNISTGWVYNNADIVKEILKHFPNLRPKYANADLPPQIQRQTMTSERWSWKPEHSFEDAVDETIAMFEKYRQDWFKSEGRN